MVQLVLIFCLAASSNSCKTLHPPFQEGYASLMGCMMQAEFVASEELRDRLDLQGYKLARWRCESGRPLGQSM
jgi:hypothetical protein